jgi:hypothetical protein
MPGRFKPLVDKRFGNLRVPRTWKGVLFVGRAFGHGAVQEMKDWPFAAALRWEAANHHMLPRQSLGGIVVRAGHE